MATTLLSPSSTLYPFSAVARLYPVSAPGQQLSTLYPSSASPRAAVDTSSGDITSHTPLLSSQSTGSNSRHFYSRLELDCLMSYSGI